MIFIKRTISIAKGKGSIGHNTRNFKADNVNGERSKLNICYINEDIQVAYHKLFDTALKGYNEKQKRSDRKIDDYYEKIRTSKQEKLFYELVVQVGNSDDMACGSENETIAKNILDKYMNEFQKRNPNLYVFSAHLHLDEATPHLHIDYIPYSTENKRGLETRNSLKGALLQQGFKGGTRGDTELTQWQNSEKERLAKIMLEYGVEWEQKGTHREHLSVLDYKKKMRAEEVVGLKQQQAVTSRAVDRLEMVLEQKQEKLDSLADADSQLTHAIETKRELAEQAENRLEICQKKSSRISQNLTSWIGYNKLYRKKSNCVL